MTGCAARCKTVFHEDGIENLTDDMVCFKNCVFKANEFGANLL